MEETARGRFAPSPSGRMHLGNVFTALLAWLSVRASGGTMVLRMEDLDPDRCRAEYAEVLADDLRWLGLDWDEGYQKGGPHGPYLQSERTFYYKECFEHLEAEGLYTPASAPGRSGWPPRRPTGLMGGMSIPAAAGVCPPPSGPSGRGSGIRPGGSWSRMSRCLLQTDIWAGTKRTC